MYDVQMSCESCIEGQCTEERNYRQHQLQERDTTTCDIWARETAWTTVTTTGFIPRHFAHSLLLSKHPLLILRAGSLLHDDVMTTILGPLHTKNQVRTNQAYPVIIKSAINQPSVCSTTTHSYVSLWI